ncbi:MAG: hypothetical protein IPJ65_30235 [Archangiaceae bacterium]|nr:hypothetical protein [Archangiaceae bacterium]
MRTRRLFPLVLLVAAGAGLFSFIGCARPVGWFRADKTPAIEDDYDGRFEALSLGSDAGCDPVAARQADDKSLIIVLVPGIGGDGEEMHASLPLVMGAKPASVYMFRYRAFDARDGLVEQLASGLTRLASCIPDCAGRMLVLAHSAGGVLSSRAVAQVKPPDGVTGDWLTLITVASPLAGTSRVPSGGSPPPDRPLMLELGVKIDSYPDPVPGVRAVHLRSSAQSDGFMRPSGDHLPNDPKVGVPGAPQIDLPAGLDHSQALIYVAKKIGDGTWSEYFKPSEGKGAAATP